MITKIFTYLIYAITIPFIALAAFKQHAIMEFFHINGTTLCGLTIALLIVLVLIILGTINNETLTIDEPEKAKII